MRKNFVQEVNFLLAACVSGGSLLASYAHAAETGVAPASLNTAQVVNAPISAPPEAEKAAGTPSDGEEVPSGVSSEDDAMKPTVGNLFHPKAGQTPNYWQGLEAHVSVEGGVTGNPWTRSGRNFAQYYTDRANTATLNQIMGSISHPVTSVGKGYGLGFVFEAMYGSDARFDPTIGMGSGSLHGLYQWAPTQAHIDAHLPWIFKRGIDVQVGQMYGIMGAEGTPSQARPFYSFNYASDYIVPFETVGILATMHVTQHMDWILGVDAGNSTTFGSSGNNNKPKGYFGFAWNKLLDGKLDMHAIGHFGPQGNNGRQVTSAEGWLSSGMGKAANSLMQYNGDFMATYHVNDKMTVSVNGTYLHDDGLRDDVYGVSTYFSYAFHPWLTLNARGEVFRDNSGGVYC